MSGSDPSTAEPDAEITTTGLPHRPPRDRYKPSSPFIDCKLTHILSAVAIALA